MRRKLSGNNYSQSIIRFIREGFLPLKRRRFCLIYICLESIYYIYQGVLDALICINKWKKEEVI